VAGNTCLSLHGGASRGALPRRAVADFDGPDWGGTPGDALGGGFRHIRCAACQLLVGHSSQIDKISRIDTFIFHINAVIFHIDAVIFCLDTVILRSASISLLSSCHLVDWMTRSYFVTLLAAIACDVIDTHFESSLCKGKGVSYDLASNICLALASGRRTGRRC
jgi:hypothetical protein